MSAGIVALVGLCAGLAIAPARGTAGESAPHVLIGCALAGLALARLHSAPRAAWPALAALAAVAAVAGLAAGAIRLASMDAGALRGPAGARVTVSGAVVTVPRIDDRGLSFELDARQGRVLIRARGDPGEYPVGSLQRVSGRLEAPEPWRAGLLARHGIAMALDAERVDRLPGARGGLPGAVDAVRRRAERALDRGVLEREAALARGFVLGEDDRIDPVTRQDFRRSGLAHLLAVSGQNIVLLCLLAWPFLALTGMTLRARLLFLIALIALYVPVTGAGASIQRAGIMGAAGLAAALADRPLTRWYALLLAAAITLAVNPRVAGDVGWQLSFAAFIGILLWSGRLARPLAGGSPRGAPRRAAAEGVAVTMAAAVATAPLMAHHFDSLSVATLPANLLALPAVAPAMWAGMLAAAVGQVPWIPVEPVNWAGSLCLAYIAQVAHWFGAPAWALVQLRLPTPASLAAAYVVLAAAMEGGLAWARRRGGLGPRGALRGAPTDEGSPPRRRRRAAVLAIGAVVAAGLLPLPPGPAEREGGATVAGDALVVRVLDVGQGDAILLDPPGGDPVLVDAGPPGAGIAGALSGAGATRLGAVVVTHGDADHAGGEREVLSSTRVERLAFARPVPSVVEPARSAGVPLVRLAEGAELRSGGLRLTALWPPRALADAGTGVEPNAAAVVLLAEWRHFSMLLSSDAEAEAVPIDPGPVDVLKLAHHGSDDEGLAGLLERAAPHLVVISVGDDNPYGHPTAGTLRTLSEHDEPWLRTDEDGDVVIRADDSGWAVVG